MAHYIGMAGLSGYLPQTCDVYETYDDAVEGLASLHELGKKRTTILKRNGYIDLNLERDGNEYAEIEECDCDEPEIHSDSAPSPFMPATGLSRPAAGSKHRETHGGIETMTDTQWRCGRCNHVLSADAFINRDRQCPSCHQISIWVLVGGTFDKGQPR